jgi:hypothetical protein
MRLIHKANRNKLEAILLFKIRFALFHLCKYDILMLVV